jgi:hypothetical protein
MNCQQWVLPRSISNRALRTLIIANNKGPNLAGVRTFELVLTQ